MHHALRSAGTITALAAAALLLISGCSKNDNKDNNSAASVTSTIATSSAGPAEGTSGPVEETKIATQGGEIAVSGAIYEKYVTAGGPNGTLGLPVKAAEAGPNEGKWQDFVGGAIVWSKDTGAHIVWGEIRKAWEDNGGPAGKFGYPTTDEKDVSGGKQSDFTGGSITWIDGQTALHPNS
ncbi:esterase [Nocardia panacis]|uniref:Esterase n=1 Tax=Nocardia panacis TaxID=2340916 RepID=A0A3A4K5K2_9NOCA|nr:esterase [Nocardia panacis]RJO75891.1 esterase [Nocardia panacis]